MLCIPFTKTLIHRSSDTLPRCPASPSQRLPPIYRSSGTLPGCPHLLTETPSISRSSDILPGCSASLSQRLSFTGALIHYPDALHPLPRDSLPFTGALVHYPDARISSQRLHPFTGALIYCLDALHPFHKDSHS